MRAIFKGVKITFTLNLDGQEISETRDFEKVVIDRNELEAEYKCWANEQLIRKTGGAEGCYLKLSNITWDEGKD